ncbi:MAG: MOSC domain-containing protein [Conexibacteraceae bacterium]|nr:MOSC domain-containing protein [Conexibacteraceae bacterium]
MSARTPAVSDGAPSATVTALHTAAIKGTRLRSVASIELDERGAAGDRKFFLVDERGRMVNTKTCRDLLKVSANVEDGRLRAEFPDGTVLDGEVALGEDVPARFYSHTLSGRVVQGEWSRAFSDLTGHNLRLLAAGSAVDRGAKGAVSLISRGSLRRLGEQAQSDPVDARRFRMLIEVDGVEPNAEDLWIGRPIEVGEALLRFDGNVGRCLVTTLDPETGAVTLPTLDLLREYRGDTESTEPLPLGVWGRVLRGGTVRVGDALRFAPGER